MMVATIGYMMVTDIQQDRHAPHDGIANFAASV